MLKELGLSTSKGTAWKKGSIPTGDIVAKIAEYFGVSTDYLLTGEETTNEKENGEMDELTKRQKSLNALLILAKSEILFFDPCSPSEELGKMDELSKLSNEEIIDLINDAEKYNLIFNDKKTYIWGYVNYDITQEGEKLHEKLSTIISRNEKLISPTKDDTEKMA